MTIRNNQIYVMSLGIFQNDSKKHVAMVTEDKRVVTADGEVTVAKVARRGYSILTIYEHAL